MDETRVYPLPCRSCGQPKQKSELRSDARQPDGVGTICRVCERQNGAMYRARARPRKVGISAAERFWAKVDKQASCWLWTAKKNKSGYGHFFDGKRSVKAHRWAYSNLIGPIPDGLLVLHNCPGGDNPACVNPAHLWLGTVAENNADMMAKGRHVALSGDQHWFNQHPELRARGTRVKSAKLTPDQVIEMRSLYPSVGVTELSRRFNISRGQAYCIVRGQTWRHLLGEVSA